MRITKQKRVYLLVSVCMMAISILACRPVIAIGWGEFLSLVIVIGILLGPPLYRFIRKIEDFRKHEQKDK